MKILAIRGANLASLDGEFEIDLANGSLGGAGVFAIVGPTGAGKSTLLDAICVALFDRTPRLTNRSTVVVGRDADDPAALGAQDVRTILRRGAAAGYAEVDFESGDLRRYRARWSVRRARDRSDGNLQAQQITLTAIADGERFGGTRTETLDAIHDRLGLTFDQFRRSALLAQGEFAAFLRADGRDRSELLERMTGTEIYTRLSIAAHVKAGLADQRAREGRATLLAIPVLADDARAVLETDHAAAIHGAQAARATHLTTEAVARWVVEGVERVRARDAALVEHARAVGAVAAAEPARRELAQRKHAERLRPAWELVDGIGRRVEAVRGELASAVDGGARAAAALHEVGVRRAQVGELHAPVRAARIAVGLVERTRERGLAAAALIDAAADADWLVARQSLAPEIAAWADLDPKFAQRAAIADQIAALAGSVRGHDDQRARLIRGKATHVTDQQAATAKLAEVKVRAGSFKQRRGISLDDARRAEDEARNRLADADRLVAIAFGARNATAVQRELERQIAEVEVTERTDATQHTIVVAAQATSAIVKLERARVVDELRRAAGHAHARAELVDGEPCPLCGSPEHPWHDRGALDDVIRDAEARLAEVVAALDAQTHTRAQLEARAQAHGRERARLLAHRETAMQTAADAVPVWREQLGALHELAFELDPASHDAERLAATRETAARKQLEDARAIREQVAAAVKAAADVQAEVQLWQANLEQSVAQLAELDRRIGELDVVIERVRGERVGRVERHAELATELDAAVARWLAALPDRAAWAQRIGLGAVGEASTTPSGKRNTRFARGSLHPGTQPANTTDPDDPELGPRLDRARVALSELATAWRTRCERVADADAALAIAIAELDREAAATERAVAEHAVRRSDAERRAAELAREHAEATAKLADARAAAGFTGVGMASIDALLADRARVDTLATELAELERAVDQASALAGERNRLVAEHAAAQPAATDTPLDATSAQRWATWLEASAAAVVAAEDRRAQLNAELLADRAAHERRAAVEAMLRDAERADEVDRILGEVIGSHDGKLFRSFAQSLTLDGLLAVANSHLEELAPRYQLERVPRHDLELQVIDRDLGSERRSVQSLSGGESFLVSLALALGLSSMSAHDVRVRTLLIDEGFGSLDPATLDGALAVLDRLQATGCQVGVISHVPALVERVGAHVRVSPRGGGRSTVIVAD